MYRTLVFLICVVLGLPPAIACAWNQIVPEPTTLNDLLIPTPFTNVEEYDIANSSCSTGTVTVTVSRTAWVGSAFYPADVQTFTISFFNTTITYTYPQLLLTLLRPGDLITLSDTFTPQICVGTACSTTSEATLIVPTSITLYVTGTPASITPTPSSITIVTQTTLISIITSSSSPKLSNGLIGGIVAGVVVVIVVAIVVGGVIFVYLKKHPRSQNLQAMENNGTEMMTYEGPAPAHQNQSNLEPLDSDRDKTYPAIVGGRLWNGN